MALNLQDRHFEEPRTLHAVLMALNLQDQELENSHTPKKIQTALLSELTGTFNIKNLEIHTLYVKDSDCFYAMLMVLNLQDQEP